MPRAFPAEALPEIFRASQEQVPTERKVTLALELDRATVRSDPRVRKVEQVTYGDSVSRIAIASTEAPAQEYSRTDCWCAASALAEYRRVLKPGGVALIVEGNRFNPSFYLHMTLALGHEHFPGRRFRELVRGAFPDARFGAFEAHYVPGLRRLLPLQHMVEETFERLPPLRPLLSYNWAIAAR